MIQITTPSELRQYKDQTIVDRVPIKVDQTQIDQYLEFSRDRNQIHLARSSAQAIVPANLIISIIPSALQSQISFADHIQCFTVGYRAVKFRKLVEANTNVFLSIKFSAIRTKPETAYVDYAFHFNADGDSSTLAEGVMSDYYRFSPPKKQHGKVP